MIRIAIVEDNRVVRAGLTSLLNGVSGFSVIHAAASLDLAAIERARVLLLDIGLENGDSLEIAEQVAEELPDCRIVVMDLLPSHEDIREFVQAGVAGFVLKDATLEELESTIRAVAGGADVLPADVTSALFSQIAGQAVSQYGPESVDETRLTPREREVIDLIADGLSNKKIAASLHISTHTVKSHVRNIMEKLTLHSRLQLASWVHREGEDES